MVTRNSTSQRMIGRAQVLYLVPFSDTTLWREIQAGRFPAPVRISKQRVAWPETKVQEWIASKMEVA